MIHEQYRHPSQYYHDKEVAMRASWLGGRARSAAQPRSRIALAAHSQPLRLAAAALAGAAAVAIATRR